MAEYIEREAAMLTPVLPKEHRHYQTNNLDDAYEQGWNDALNNLKNAPAADVAPVVRGHWVVKRRIRGGFRVHEGVDEHGVRHRITVDERYEVADPYCPVCGKVNESVRLNYCPNCGARLTEEVVE